MNNDSDQIKPKKTVAIIVPIHKKSITADEAISLKHLRYFLSTYDKYFILPEDLELEIEHDDFFLKRFDNGYFKSRNTYNHLMLSESFYRAFDEYEYILIYQLDCLVFSDQLLDWCKKGYDYIGAPWYKKIVPWSISDVDIVGNGGFSLRNIESHLKVLNCYDSSGNIWKKFYNRTRMKISIFHSLMQSGYMRMFEICTHLKSRKGLKSLLNIVCHEMNSVFNEDIFWSLEAKKYFSGFKVPLVEVGVSFSFETGPKYCFEKNHHILPFGCHAWDKYDKDFWKPYLLKK